VGYLQNAKWALQEFPNQFGENGDHMIDDIRRWVRWGYVTWEELGLSKEEFDQMVADRQKIIDRHQKKVRSIFR
jgi:hypothetical protein